jgi:hypothetical protein
MTCDHHGQAAGMASLLVRAVDEILGPHRPRHIVVNEMLIRPTEQER